MKAVNTTSPAPSLRVLQADAFYTRYLDSFYIKNPHLCRASCQMQEQALIRDGFSGIHTLAPYIKNSTVISEYCIINNYYSQMAWAKEHAFSSTSAHENWQETVLRQRIEHFKPDVLYIADPIRFDAKFLASLTHRPRLTMAWRAADVPIGTDWTGYDVILSGLPPMLHLATSLGAKKGVYFVPGMPNWIAREVEDLPHDVDVVFVGGISPTQHVKRLFLLDLVAQAAQKHGFSLALHLACDPTLVTESMRPFTHPPVFGLDMHRALRRGRIVLDTQGTIGLRRPDGSYVLDLARGATSNMRLFEATGGGSLLLTEHQDDLPALFEPSKEVATYTTATEMVDTITYYLHHDVERQTIAAAGKARCLGQWNMQKRAKAFMDIVHQCLSSAGSEPAQSTTNQLAQEHVAMTHSIGQVDTVVSVAEPSLFETAQGNSMNAEHDYPNIFAIETVLGCNLRCVECAVGGNLVRRPYGHLKLAQFQIIAERIRPYCTYAYLHIWGEPMINPDIIPIIQVASTFTQTNISTNANTLDEHLAKDLIYSGVTDIIVSIDGMSQEVYSQYRRRGHLDKAQLGLIYLTKHRLRSGKQIKISPQFIVFEHNKHEMHAFAQFCQELGLQAVFKAPYLRPGSTLCNSGLSDFERHISASPEQRRQNMRTCTLDKDCNILLDGSVVACCYDHNGQTTFGNIYTHSVEEIWQNPQYVAFRQHVHAGTAPEFCTSQCLAF